ncbi:hypothetical protein GCM10027346_12180 [Hymenobacter seoulensis]
MRIAFVALMSNAPWGGSEVLWTKTASYALDKGHDVFFSTYNWPALNTNIELLIKKGAMYYLRPLYNLQSRIINKICKKVGLEFSEISALKKFNPDLILFNQGGAYTLMYHSELIDYVNEYKVPYALICHSYTDNPTLDKKQRNFINSIFANSKKIFTVSTSQVSIIERQLAARILSNVIVQNPWNIPKINPLPFPSETLDIPQFASIASLTVHTKGQDLLFEALGSTKWRQRSWVLNLFGEGPDKEYLEDLALFYGIGDRVKFHGHVQDIVKIWSFCHLLILSSRIDSGPMVVVEAMICGRPVVATPVGLVSDWLSPGLTGYITHGISSNAIDESLEMAWENKSDWEKIGLHASISAAKQIDVDPVNTFLDHLITSGN